jgi:hypothetical protein
VHRPSVWSTVFYGGMKARLYVPRVITRFHEAKTLVVLPFIMPPREGTMGWNGRLLLGR